MTQIHKGIATQYIPKGARPVEVERASVVAVPFTAPDADNTKFPLNEPIALIGGPEILEGMGDTGTGPDFYKQVFAEGVGITSVGVRVEPGADTAATLANVVGDAGAKTGVHALKYAQAELGLTPRLYVAPGFTSQRLGSTKNPVTTALEGIATARRGVVYVDGPNTTKEAAVAARGDYGTPRIFMIDPAVKVFRGGQNVIRPGSSTAIGITLRVDRDLGPNNSPSNHPALGITGLARTVDYADGDADTEADYLTRNKIATFIREDGFRLWGNETAAVDPLDKFLPVVRTHDLIMDSVAKAHRDFRDRRFSVQLLTDIGATVNGFLRKLKGLGWTIGYEVWIDPTLNTIETWLAGDLFVSYDGEAPAPLQRLIFQFNRNTGYYAEMRRQAIAAVAGLS